MRGRGGNFISKTALFTRLVCSVFRAIFRHQRSPQTPGNEVIYTQRRFGAQRSAHGLRRAFLGAKMGQKREKRGKGCSVYPFSKGGALFYPRRPLLSHRSSHKPAHRALGLAGSVAGSLLLHWCKPAEQLLLHNHRLMQLTVVKGVWKLEGASLRNPMPLPLGVSSAS